MIALTQVILGSIQLLLGRRIFWLMVGIAGFLVGLYVTVYTLNSPAWLKILIGLGAGLIAALLAVVIPKPMAAIFAFLAFGLAAVLFASALGVQRGSTVYWIILVGTGLAGAILAFVLFDWALIIGTSLIGAGAVTAGLAVLLKFPPNGILAILLFLILIVIGVLSQSRTIN
jgi:drug/metabolite transporter (DMT)-like permease